MLLCARYHQQYAAVSALKNGDPDVEMMRESYDQRRRFLLNAFREMGIDCFEPLGAFYTFPNISRFGMTSEEFATKLLMEEKVAVVPGTAFGACGEGFVRISYAYSLKSLKEALSRIERFVKRMMERQNKNMMNVVLLEPEMPLIPEISAVPAWPPIPDST